jgi:hypothetical protein
MQEISELLLDAERAADTLAALRHTAVLPGHLLHMPAHIFLRVGRWQAAIEVRPRHLWPHVTLRE